MLLILFQINLYFPTNISSLIKKFVLGFSKFIDNSC